MTDRDKDPPPEKTRNSALTIERIVAAAEEEFGTHGLDGAKIDDIARTAGISKQLIYHYFNGKDDLYSEMLSNIAERNYLRLGSIEYAVAELGVPLIVVMGHESCGAVKAAKAVVDDNATFPGSIGRMIEPIIPAVLEVRGSEGDMLDNAIRANVSRVVKQLRTTTDPLLLDPQAAGKLKVVGAHYDLDTGKVDFFDQP